MPPRLKRAPPYEDDPECKYVVIDDPWPGNKFGKERDEIYWNLLCAWVRFMLDKKHGPECVFSVNTRNEVIVQLPEEVDIVPILGAHPWIKMFTHGDPRDRDRVSHVFAYNYRMKGEPGNHNWLANYPTETEDPPPHVRFPVRFPYPHVSWAEPRGKNCASISLPLPPTRQPTPIPDTSGFIPYQHPSQLISSTISHAEAAREERDRDRKIWQGVGSGQSGKMDPDTEEKNALRSLKQEDTDVKPHVKREDSVRVKLEPEPAPYGPSKSFRSAIEQLQQSRASRNRQSTTLSNEPLWPNGVKPEEEHRRGPSDAFIAAFQTVRGAERHEQPVSASERNSSAVCPQQPGSPSRIAVTAKVKDEMEETPYQPSSAFVTAVQGLRRPPGTIDELLARTPPMDVLVKPDPDVRRSYTYSASPEDARIKRETADGKHRIAAADGTIAPVKRVKEEPHEGRHGKRIRR